MNFNDIPPFGHFELASVGSSAAMDALFFTLDQQLGRSFSYKWRVFLLTIPSGKRLHNYGKIHHFSWENSLFQWPFSIAILT